MTVLIGMFMLNGCRGARDLGGEIDVRSGSTGETSSSDESDSIGAEESVVFDILEEEPVFDILDDSRYDIPYSPVCGYTPPGGVDSTVRCDAYEPLPDYPPGFRRCPEGLVAGSPCTNSGLDFYGCCDANGNNWYCSNGTVIFDDCSTSTPD